MLVTNEVTVLKIRLPSIAFCPSGFSGRNCWNASTPVTTTNMIVLKIRRLTVYCFQFWSASAARPITLWKKPSTFLCAGPMRPGAGHIILNIHFPSGSEIRIDSPRTAIASRKE